VESSLQLLVGMNNSELDWDTARKAAKYLDLKIELASMELCNRWQWIRPRIEGQLLTMSNYLRELQAELEAELQAEEPPIMRCEEPATHHPST
jgi:hypothetical protein